VDDFSIAVLSLAACVFAVSAAAKLRTPGAYRSFRDGLGETGLMPGRLLPATAALLSGAEAVIAAGLIAAAVLTAVAAPGAIPLAEFALAAAALLASVLAAGVAVVMHRGTRARCACFGAGSGRPLGRAHLARNLTLLAVICAGLAGPPLAHGRPAVGTAVIAAAAGAVAAMLFIRWEDLAELFAPIPPPLGGSAPQAGRSVSRHD
jgi:hypothetical protein